MIITTTRIGHEKAPASFERPGAGRHPGRGIDMSDPRARRQPRGEDLRMLVSDRSGVCPRCHTFIRKGSLLVKLERPEAPWSTDNRRCWRTGGFWYWNGQAVSPHPRWYVHWRCYVDVMVEECACVYCGAEDDMTVDHLVPRRYGGSDQPRNLVPACRSCNSRKHTLPAALVGARPSEVAAWLISKGWVQIEKNRWRSPRTSEDYTRAVACRIAAYGKRVIGTPLPPVAPAAAAPLAHEPPEENRLW